jgi:TonB family protein
MTVMKHVAAAVIPILMGVGALAQDPLSAAKDLYASAAYEDALSALARVKEGAPHLALQADQYRAFSLFALGRTAEAETVVESVVRRDPLVVPDARDASPRITAMFARVQKRMLPELIRDGYRDARATMDGGDMRGAMPKLQQVRKMLDAADAIGAGDEALADLGVLVDGFIDLGRSFIEREAAEAEAAAAKAAAEAVAAPPPAPAPETVINRPPPVYTAADAGVIAPVPIRQQLPSVPHTVARTMTKSTGVIEVTINEKGGVDNVMMREPVNVLFDSMVLAAAKSWQYKPATKDGEPVKYIKRIAVAVAGLAK